MLTPLARRNIRLLALCQALYTAAISIDLTLTGLAGYLLASNKALATLPLSLIIATSAITTLFASRWQARVGRRWGFATGALIGAAGAGISVLAMWQQHFVLFCVGTSCIGVFQAFAGYYRLAAADQVDGNAKGRAIATVMTGGVVAALLGPLLAQHSQNMLPGVTFGGAYLVAFGLGLLSALLILAFYQDAPVLAATAGPPAPPRPWRVIAKQPVFRAALANNIAAYALMVCLMTATPIAMLGCGFGVADGAGVIQWHMLGMFAPSFVSGALIQRFGVTPISLTGAALLAAAAWLAQSNVALPTFYTALMLLGVGWNFMYVAGSTLLAQSYSASERTKTQGSAEFAVSALAALASFSAAPLLQKLGWSGLNRWVLPLLLLPILATLSWEWRRRKTVAPAAS